jgi:hypothetical protein
VICAGLDEDGGALGHFDNEHELKELRISRSHSAPLTHVRGRVSGHPALMRRSSYAISWTEGNGLRHAGKLQLSRLHLLLSGNRAGRVAVPLDEINSVSYGRGKLILVRKSGPPIRIESLDAPGALLELAGQLASSVA